MSRLAATSEGAPASGGGSATPSRGAAPSEGGSRAAVPEPYSLSHRLPSPKSCVSGAGSPFGSGCKAAGSRAGGTGARVAVPAWPSHSSAGDCGRGIGFTVSRNGELTPVFVVRFHGAVHAYVNRCAHRRLKLDWNAGEFFDAWGNHLLCATHKARYAPARGVCVTGVVARPVW